MPDLTTAQQDRMQRLLVTALREAVDALPDSTGETAARALADRRTALDALIDRPRQP
ncbi:hypothetical protein [Actinoplanes sp. G11-F43]|uniref:hypothetical protein n=1 Tax=Actinoplanes sp. G11-F43 TaxID=3424130 RepID=UPI003D32F27C